MLKENKIDLLFYGGTYVVFDTESTSLQPNDIYGKLTEIGAVKVENGHITDTFSMLIDPECDIPKSNIQLTGITPAMVKGQPKYPEVIRKFKEFCGDECILVMHNAPHDLKFMDYFGTRCGVKFDYPVLDTLPLSKIVYPEDEVMNRQRSAKASYKLNDLCNMLGINDPSHHRAWNDAKVTALLMNEMKKRVIEKYPNYAEVTYEYNHFNEREISDTAYKAVTNGHFTNRIRKDAKASSVKIGNIRPWDMQTKKGRILRLYFNLYVEVEGRSCDATVYYDILNQAWGIKNSPVGLPDGLFDQLGRYYMKKKNITDMSLDSIRKVEALCA